VRSRQILVALSLLAVVSAGLPLAATAFADSTQPKSTHGSSAFAKKSVPSKPKPSASAKPKPAKPTKPGIPKPRTCAKGGTCVLGDIGPGGGLVFLISGGLRYEMAPKAWSGVDTPDARASWCDSLTDVPVSTGTAVGTGSANTAKMFAAGYGIGQCSSNAAAVVLAYGGTDASVGQWFLPSKDELNAMCYFVGNPTATPDPTVNCYLSFQRSAFYNSDYGLPGAYWSSSEQIWQGQDSGDAFWQMFSDGGASVAPKFDSFNVRPIRAF
jgi:hypothetical protein